MSRTLNLVDELLARGRNFQRLGKTAEARRILAQLAEWQSLPEEAAEETYTRLGEICLQSHDGVQSRRYFESAIRLRPRQARYHHLLARACELIEEAGLEEAYEHYCQSLELEPEQPECLADFGLLAIHLGKEEEGLNCLQRAVELAEDDPNLLCKLVDGLCALGRDREARRALQLALFRHPRHLGFRKLWNDFQFQQLHEQQQTRFVLTGADSNEPRTLPFIRPGTGAVPNEGQKRIRKDGPAVPAGPHRPRRTAIPGRKHA